MSRRVVDDVSESTAPSPTRRSWLAGVAALNALAAWAGAVAVVTGAIDFGEPTNDRLPFDSVVLAGVALAIIVAIPLTVLAWSAWTAATRTDDIALVAGVVLIGWIVVQVAVLRSFSLFQPAYLCIGIYFVAASNRIRLGRRLRGVLLVTLGAVLAAAGLGLGPHLVKAGFTITSSLSVVLLLGGIATTIMGARSALRDRHLPSKIAGSVATVLVIAVAVSVIAPAVAATNVPLTKVTSTPEALGLDDESVTLTTADGVELAAWYIQGTNRAGVVMMHGAGSTRSSVLGQAAAVVGGGYAVLLIDARGHGDSRGTAMDFGWYGDLDIAAGTEFLASRPEIDANRIGVVGFSMGGEEAIGAAATNPRIRAVVAEGATARQAADKAWLSEAFGWRGRIQEQLEAIQYGITDFLTDASPPISLRSAVVRAANAHFLLITAGNVGDEGRAAAYMRSGASDRVAVWNVAGADHTGGYGTQRDEWRRRVVDFLDQCLR